MDGVERMLAAASCRPTDATPVWFMRQAGRSLPQYRRLRERLTLIEMVRDPELCAQVTCLPVDVLGVDAAVLFADIMLPLEGMGVDFEIREEVGPVIAEPIRTEAQVDRLRVLPAQEATPYLFEAIPLIRGELGSRAALMGFGAAPFTLAAYLVEGHGSRDYPTVRALIYREPRLWARLMNTLTEVLARYLEAQAAAGAHMVQLFDSWVGVLDAKTFRAHVAPHLRRLVGRVSARAPLVYFSTASGHLLGEVAACQPAGISVDWRVPLDQAWDLVGRDRFLQGNLDPALCLAPWEELALGARRVLQVAAKRPGHIFNLGHGVLPGTDPGQLRRLVELVHESTSVGGEEGQLGLSE